MTADRRKRLIRAITLAALLVPALDYALVRHDSRPASVPLPSHLQTAQSPADMLERVLHYRADERAEQRALYLQAEQALALRQLTRYRQLAPKLVDYPLYPYLQYEDLKRRLAFASRSEIDQFLREYDNLPVAASLRHRVLKRAAKRHDWASYRHFYRASKNIVLQCHALNARLHGVETSSVYADIQALWLSGQSRPNECDPVFAQWQAAGQLSDELLWQRIALTLGKGRRQLASYLARQLPAQERHWAQLWIGLHRYPEQLARRHKALLKPHPRAKQIYLASVQRLAQRKPQKAIDFLQQYSVKFNARLPLSTAEQASIDRSIAMALALRHLPGAESWYARIPAEYQTHSSRSWRVRAAIRDSDWPRVIATIAAMPDSQKGSDRWRYWQARALAETGDRQQADRLLKELAGQRNYYGFLAADRMNLPYPMQVQPYQPSAAELFVLQEQPAIRRAAELFQLGRQTAARREWRIATRHLTETQRQQAAKLAQLWGWNEQSILTMASTSHRDDLALRFPLLFKDEVLALSERKGLEAAWTYGVIRRESAFTTDARSSKGAVGLMQLMPATAKRISRSEKVRYRGNSTLLQPETNLKLGTGHLAKMLKRFDDQTVLATAAYNAGARRVKQWLPENTEMEADRWIETIPYKETREYVSNVLAYTVIYSSRLGHSEQRLQQRMTPVQSGQ